MVDFTIKKLREIEASGGRVGCRKATSRCLMTSWFSSLGSDYRVSTCINSQARQGHVSKTPNSKLRLLLDAAVPRLYRFRDPEDHGPLPTAH